MDSRRKKKHMRNHTATLSFSASLPDDVRGPYADSLCAVKYSRDPFVDLRESILEMIKNVGVRNWEEMEELIYCYVVLNSSEIHGFIWGSGSGRPTPCDVCPESDCDQNSAPY